MTVLQSKDDASPLLAALNDADPGDEVFRRFRYQSAYAAVLALDLLDDNGEVVEVYCEHHEDILLRLRGGKFRGVQVKTRDEGAARLKATDPQILDALLRFIELDAKYPGEFVGFALATNSAFDSSGRGHGNLVVVLDEAKAASIDSNAPCQKARDLAATLISRFKARVESNRKIWQKAAAAKLKKAKEAAKKAKAKAQKKAPAPATSTTPPGEPLIMATTELHEDVSVPPAEFVAPPSPTVDAVLNVLARVGLSDDLPKLADTRGRIRQRLTQLSTRVKAATVVAAELIVDELERNSHLASSRADEERNGCLWFMSDPAARAAMRVQQAIQGKRITREMIEAAIQKHCTGSLLRTADVKASDLPPDLTVVEKKLVLGGLSGGVVSVARDAVANALERGVELLYIYEPEEGARRVEHARVVAKKEAVFAYEAKVAQGERSGPAMLLEVERRLQSRRREDVVLQDFKEEHLLGHVFALTGECVVWWSESRDLGPPALDHVPIVPASSEPADD